MTTELSRKIATRLLGLAVGDEVQLVSLPEGWRIATDEAEAWIGMTAIIVSSVEFAPPGWRIRFTTTPPGRTWALTENYIVPAKCLEAL